MFEKRKAKNLVKKITNKENVIAGLHKEIDALEILIKTYSRGYNEYKSEKKSKKVQGKIDKIKEKISKQMEEKNKMVKQLMMLNGKMQFVDVDSNGKPIQVNQEEMDVPPTPKEVEQEQVEQQPQPYPLEQETPEEFEAKVLQQGQDQQQPEEVIEVPRQPRSQMQRHSSSPEPEFQPQRVQQPEQQQERMIKAKILLYDAITVNVPESEIQNFLLEVQDAIDNKKAFNIGNKMINGQHIVEVLVE